MKAYSYDESGLFIAAFDCREDPRHPGRFAVPANATTTPPPAFDAETQLCRWDGAEWIIEDKPVPPEPGPEPEPQPSAMDRLEAQVLYTALLTDTLLEEE